MKWPFLGGFWALYPANMTRVCWNFNQRSVFHETKTGLSQFYLEQSFKSKCLSRNGHIQSWWFWSIFGPNFPPVNPKYCQKPIFFPRNCILMTINNTSARSQINYRILINLIKKTIFGAKYGLFKVKNWPVNKDQEVRDQVSTTFTKASNSWRTFGENFLL